MAFWSTRRDTTSAATLMMTVPSAAVRSGLACSGMGS